MTADTLLNMPLELVAALAKDDGSNTLHELVGNGAYIKTLHSIQTQP